ncbi:MAG: peptidyl-prolyl cis-trans isomerase [Proteobacteria bacterium]|nr:peptidyl-prolyl cis-trans isomerase [Pseudomonadota bacterium]
MSDWRDRLRRLLAEPLVHFLLAGAVVYALLAGRAPDLGERRIVVDRAVAEALVQRFVEAFHRPPDQGEIDGLIRDHVADQVYYREALRLGLDKDDEVVVRRMRRKLEQAAASDAETRTPSDAELQALIDKDPARYAAEPRLSFEQVYLGADNPAIRAQAPALLRQLASGQRVDGVPAPLERVHTGEDSATIAAGFGDEFAVALASQPVGSWHGPVKSGLGLHLVRITARTASAKPVLAKVRQRVENDWRAAAVRDAQARDYARMAKGYDIVIEPGH